MKILRLAVVILFMAYLVAAAEKAPEEAPASAVGKPKDAEEAPAFADLKPKDTEEASASADGKPKDGEEAPGSLLVEAIVLGAILRG